MNRNLNTRLSNVADLMYPVIAILTLTLVTIATILW